MCPLMVALTFAAIGEPAEFMPPIEKITLRLDVNRGRHWSVEGEVRCKVPLDKRAAYKDMFDSIMQDLTEDSVSDWGIDLHSKLTYPDDDHAVLTVHGKGGDPVMLVMVVRALFEFGDCTFSWSGDKVHIAGKRAHIGPGIVGVIAVIIEPSLEPVLAGKVPVELIVSSEGSIRTTGMPAKVDEDGHRMVMRMNDLDPAPDELWSFSVDGLGEK